MGNTVSSRIATLFGVAGIVLSFSVQSMPVAAAGLFDDYMATLQSLLPNSPCVDEVPGQKAFCHVRGDAYDFEVGFGIVDKPAFYIAAQVPGRSMDGLRGTMLFYDAVEAIGLERSAGDCSLQSLERRSTPIRFSTDQYDFECAAFYDQSSRMVTHVLRVTSRTAVRIERPNNAAGAVVNSPGAGWPGVWQVTALPDGRLYAKVEMVDDGDMEYGGFSSFGIICARGGGLKIGLETLDGTTHASVYMNPDDPNAFALPLMDNEIRGPQADQFLSDLADIAQLVRDGGTADQFPLAFSAWHDGEYVSVFDLVGIEEVTERLRRDCAG